MNERVGGTLPKFNIFKVIKIITSLIITINTINIMDLDLYYVIL